MYITLNLLYTDKQLTNLKNITLPCKYFKSICHSDSFWEFKMNAGTLQMEFPLNIFKIY